jgi:hypothetical protein
VARSRCRGVQVTQLVAGLRAELDKMAAERAKFESDNGIAFSSQQQAASLAASAAPAKASPGVLA